jgi:hypothetical protein
MLLFTQSLFSATTFCGNILANTANAAWIKSVENNSRLSPILQMFSCLSVEKYSRFFNKVQENDPVFAVIAREK